jgi:hypothetical protein
MVTITNGINQEFPFSFDHFIYKGFTVSLDLGLHALQIFFIPGLSEKIQLELGERNAKMTVNNRFLRSYIIF